jgi:hypothetical protein
MLTIKQTMATLGVATSTIHRSTTASLPENSSPPRRRSLVHSPHRRFAFARRKKKRPKDISHVSGHAHRLGRFPADRVAACQEREIEAIRVRNGGKKGLRLKLNCSQPTSATKPQK